MGDLLSQKEGVENERMVRKHYTREGYTVFNVNKSFPDLTLIKDGRVVGFVEVKGGEHHVHPPQRRTLEELKKLGFQALVVRVVKGKIIVEKL